MEQQGSNALYLRTEIAQFIEKAFSGCKIFGDFNPDQGCWVFKMSFGTQNHMYTIRPPKGCCLMEVSSTDTKVEFKIVLFVEDFKKYHVKSILN
jgi:hypothetical protein